MASFQHKCTASHSSYYSIDSPLIDHSTLADKLLGFLQVTCAASLLFVTYTRTVHVHVHVLLCLMHSGTCNHM